MLNISDKNGIVFWDSSSLLKRIIITKTIVKLIEENLRKQNNAFRFFQIESPILINSDETNTEYKESQFFTNDNLALRPETTKGSYKDAVYLLENHEENVKLPIVVWQIGKSFRREKDQPLSKVKLKEFNQLEFQIIYNNSTKNDYLIKLLPQLVKEVSAFVGECITETSDRLPLYSKETIDIVHKANSLEVCSISRRQDFPKEKIDVLEVAFGIDRLVYLYARN